MPRLPLFFALCACLFLARPGLAADPDPLAATVISLDGDVRYDDEGVLKPVQLGQLLDVGDRVLTLENSTLHMILADGSSVVMAPNTEMTLGALGDGKPGSKTLLQVLKGLLNLMVEKQPDGFTFEVETSNAVAAVKGTDFEVNADTDDTQVTVNEGEVHLGDPGRKRFEPIHPLERSHFHGGRLDRAMPLSKREAGEFRGRWERARMIHQQRHELIKHFRETGKAERKRFRQRHERRQVKHPELRKERPGQRQKERRAEKRGERRFKKKDQ